MAETKIVNLQISDNLNATTDSVKSLKAQLREAQNDVTQLSEKFGATSKEAINAAKKAGILKDAIGDAKALTDAFNPDAKFKALSSSLSGVAGGFAAVQGGMALFGSESENVEKTLLKVQSAMALSQGLQTIGESVDSFKQLGAVLKSNVAVQKVLTVSQAAYTTVVGASTGALKLLRIALAATGIGAIVVGLGLLIANFDKVKKAVFNLIPGLTQVGEVIGDIVNAVTDFVGATSEAERALESMMESADKSLANNKKFLQQHGSQLDEFTKKKVDAKNKYLEAIKEEGNSEKDRVALGKELNRQLAAIDKEREDARVKKNKDASDKIKAADAKLAADKKIADEKALADKKIADELYFKQILDNQEKIKNQSDQVSASLAEFEALDKEAKDKANQEDFDLKVEQGKRLESNFEIIKVNAEKEIQLERDKIAAKQQALNDISSIFGAESAIGKAALVAKQVLNAKELLMDAGKTLGFINLKAAESTVAITSGAAKTAAVGFPQNIPLLIGYAAQAAGIFGAIKSAVKAAKGSVSTPSIITGGGAMSAAAATAPQFNVVGTSGVNQIAQGLGNQSPVQAYVVGSQVTTQQALDRNIVRTATLGG